MDRWKLVGDAALNLLVVFDIFLSSPLDADVKEMSSEKTCRISSKIIHEALKANNQWMSRLINVKDD